MKLPLAFLLTILITGCSSLSPNLSEQRVPALEILDDDIPHIDVSFVADGGTIGVSIAFEAGRTYEYMIDGRDQSRTKGEVFYSAYYKGTVGLYPIKNGPSNMLNEVEKTQLRQFLKTWRSMWTDYLDNFVKPALDEIKTTENSEQNSPAGAGR